MIFLDIQKYSRNHKMKAFSTLFNHYLLCNMYNKHFLVSYNNDVSSCSILLLVKSKFHLLLLPDPAHVVEFKIIVVDFVTLRITSVNSSPIFLC